MDQIEDFIFDDMCEEFFPAIEWMLEECDDVEEKDIPKLLTEDDDMTLDQAKRIFAAYKENNA